MDEIGVLLSLLKELKVLVSKAEMWQYRGVGTKRTLITVIECVSADGQVLLPLAIWPASTHRSNQRFIYPDLSYSCLILPSPFLILAGLF
jgi:hypothetical protein